MHVSCILELKPTKSGNRQKVEHLQLKARTIKRTEQVSKDKNPHKLMYVEYMYPKRVLFEHHCAIRCQQNINNNIYNSSWTQLVRGIKCVTITQIKVDLFTSEISWQEANFLGRNAWRKVKRRPKQQERRLYDFWEEVHVRAGRRWEFQP